MSIEYDYKRASLQAAIACMNMLNLYDFNFYLIGKINFPFLNNQANNSIPAGLFWTSGSDEGCEGKFGWCSVNKLVRNAQWASAQPDNAGGSENCLSLNLDTAKAELQDEDCSKLLHLICEAFKKFFKHHAYLFVILYRLETPQKPQQEEKQSKTSVLQFTTCLPVGEN